MTLKRVIKIFRMKPDVVICALISFKSTEKPIHLIEIQGNEQYNMYKPHQLSGIDYDDLQGYTFPASHVATVVFFTQVQIL